MERNHENDSRTRQKKTAFTSKMINESCKAFKDITMTLNYRTKFCFFPDNSAFVDFNKSRQLHRLSKRILSFAPRIKEYLGIDE